MLSPRSFLSALALTVAVTGAGCRKHSQPGPKGPITTDGSGPNAPGGTVISEKPSAAVEKIQVLASLRGVADTFDVVKEIGTRWGSGSSSDPRAELQASLLQSGFSPAFLDNLDLAGTHAVWFAYPKQGSSASMRDANLAASIAVIDGVKVIQGIPESSRPQPLGEGVWQLKTNDIVVMLREAGKELHVGFSPEDMARAAKLRSEIGGDRRLSAKVWNIPSDDLDPSALFGLPSDSRLAKDLSKVAKELGAVELGADLGMDRDGVLTISAEAPFGKLGIEPIGAPRAAATALEGRLPGDPMFVATLSWGNPTLVQKIINEQVPVSQIPEPFAAIVKQAMKGATDLLGQLAEDVVVAVYVDAKGKASVLLAAGVKDAAAARTSMRSISEAVRQAVESQQALAGKNKDAQIGFELKLDGAALAGGKADKMVLRAPKSAAAELEGADVFLDKGALQLISFVRDTTAVVVIGGNAAKLAGEAAKGLSKPPRNGLGQHEGLKRLRASMGGCSVCVAMDPVDYLRLRLAMLAAKEPGQAKAAKARLAAIKKLPEVADPAFGIRVEKARGALGLIVPREVIFADKSAIDAAKKANDLVSGNVGSSDASAPKPEKKPGGKKAAGKKQRGVPGGVAGDVKGD